MKRFITSVIIMAAIIVYSAVNSITAVKFADELIAATDDLTDKLRSSDTQSAAAYAENYCRKWYEKESRLSLILQNGRISEINSSVAKIVPMTESGSDELLAELANIRRRLEKIKTEEIPAWYNIL